jgi:hypothetical protein
MGGAAVLGQRVLCLNAAPELGVPLGVLLAANALINHFVRYGVACVGNALASSLDLIGIGKDCLQVEVVFF